MSLTNRLMETEQSQQSNDQLFNTTISFPLAGQSTPHNPYLDKTITRSAHIADHTHQRLVQDGLPVRPSQPPSVTNMAQQQCHFPRMNFRIGPMMNVSRWNTSGTGSNPYNRQYHVQRFRSLADDRNGIIDLNRESSFRRPLRNQSGAYT